MQGPDPGVLIVGAIVIVALVIGIWFFLLRGDGGATSAFLGAYDHFVAAERTVEGATAQVERFSELESFDATVNAQRRVMEHQSVIFNRLASEQGGDSARLAGEAAAASRLVINALDGYAAAILDRRLADAAFSLAQMQAPVGDLDRAAAEWKKLH